jgi:hypothetical protein
MAQHGAVSIVVDIKPGKKQVLRDKFKEIEVNGVDTNSTIPFRKISSIHFARFVVFDEGYDAYGKPFPSRMAFTTNYDLPLNDHLQQLVDIAGNGLWEIFSLCLNFPENTSYNQAKLLEYLKANLGRTETFYVGVGHRSVLQIQNENELREAIESYADSQYNAFKNKDAVFIRKKIIEFVNGTPSLAWAKIPAPKGSLLEKTSFYGKLVLVIALFLAFLPVIIPFVVIWLWLILINEITTKDKICELDKGHLRILTEREKGIVQTQYSGMGNVKPGWIRKTTMLFLLRMTNFLAPYLFSKGKLSGIPTVHFARWLIINEGKQMIFLSNFDGNSESYLRDFINIAAKQLTLMFCHTVGYPKTRLMLFGGAKDAEGFMGWARSYQVITNVWYNANKNVSVNNIFNNSAIRDGLYGEMNEQEARKWLSRL